MNAADIYDLRFFMMEQGERVLIAMYFTSEPPPEIGSVIDIQSFKDEDRYPDQVRVLELKDAPRDELAVVDEAQVIFVLTEPL